MCCLVWYKRYPRDFREGTRKLTFEERGFYGDVLDLIYECGNELADDDAANAHRLHADLRSYRRLKAKLIELGKLHLADGCLRNARATAVATDAATRIAKARAAGKLGGSSARKSDPESGNSNDIAEADAQADAQAFSRETPDSRIREEDSESIADSRGGEESRARAQGHAADAAPRPPDPASSVRVVQAKATHLPPDWLPSPDDWAYARAQGMTDADITRIADDFRDYWFAASGERASSRAWDASWRRWIRRENQRAWAASPANRADHRGPAAGREPRPAGIVAALNQCLARRAAMDGHG